MRNLCAKISNEIQQFEHFYFKFQDVLFFDYSSAHEAYVPAGLKFTNKKLKPEGKKVVFQMIPFLLMSKNYCSATNDVVN